MSTKKLHVLGICFYGMNSLGAVAVAEPDKSNRNFHINASDHIRYYGISKIGQSGTESDNGGATFRPVFLLCPKENNNKIRLIRKNEEGILFELEATYRGKIIVNVNASANAFVGDVFRKTLSGRPNSISTTKDNSQIFQFSQQLQKIKDAVCDSKDPTIRERYRKVLKDNDTHLENMKSKRGITSKSTDIK